MSRKWQSIVDSDEPLQFGYEDIIWQLEKAGRPRMAAFVEHLARNPVADSLRDQLSREKRRADRLAERLAQYERPAVPATMRSHRAGPESDG
jgi:hypothetical protein